MQCRVEKNWKWKGVAGRWTHSTYSTRWQMKKAFAAAAALVGTHLASCKERGRMGLQFAIVFQKLEFSKFETDSYGSLYNTGLP